MIRQTLINYWGLARPRILAMVVLTMGAAAFLAGPAPGSRGVLVAGIAASAAVILGALALNQRLERDSDAQMPRTAPRPLPSGGLTSLEATLFGLVVSSAGLAALAIIADSTTVFIAAASWLLYVALYTPLKRISPWQTPVGALAGAMPVLLGASTAGNPLRPLTLGLTAVVFFWQFPHAMAIAWIYRHEFADARVQLATVVEPTGRAAGLLAIVGAAMTLMAGIACGHFGRLGMSYMAIASVLGVVYVAAAAAFFAARSDQRARRLLLASVIYLPALLAAMLLAR